MVKETAEQTEKLSNNND